MSDMNRGRVRVEWSGKRVRAVLGGEVVLDTTRPLLVWEGPHYPTYYVRVEDVRAELIPSGHLDHSPSRGDGEVHDLRSGRITATGAARVMRESPIPELAGTVRVAWDAMDDWFEEDEPVYTHARDPYTRVDILASSRRVRVAVDGVTVAESCSPRILFETHLPPRYYLPITDIRMDLLRPSETVTHCPYKGAATYWSLEIDDKRYEDLVWIYRTPLPESQKIAGLACFYNEKVDLFVDDVEQERPTR
ncbi:MAG TPA: DUF427 domain-containing protein [Micromonosporaceae bacterium]|jgi:uncharacterized protein (DUF427 family)